MWGKDKSPDNAANLGGCDTNGHRRTREELHLKDSAIENSANAIAMTDLEGNITYVNQACTELWGNSDKNELLGRPYWEFLEVGEAVKDIAAALRERGAWEGKLLGKRKDGRGVPLHVQAGVARDSLGNPFQTICCLIDITARKGAEKTLEDAEDSFKRFLEEMNDGYCVLQGLTIVFASARGARMFGYDKEDVIGKSIRELLPDSIVEELLEVNARRQSGESVPPQYETVLVKKDGTECPVELSARVTSYAGEQAVSVVIRDITPRREMERALRESEQSYRTLFEAALEGVIVIDAETLGILIANRAAASMYGFDCAEEAVGANPLDFVHRDDREQALRIIVEEVLQRDMRQIHEFRTVTRDGRELWTSAVGAPTEYEGRRACLVSMRDITERKRAEEENHRIEQQLQVTKRLAGVGKLAAGLAHELSNPLAAVEASAQFLAVRKDLEESIRKDVETICREAQRASRITQNLLCFARRQEPDRSHFCTNEAVAKAVESHAARMKAHNIDLALELQPDLPTTVADGQQMEQVFVNLITNAEQAVTEAHGRGRLCVTTQRAGDMVRIAFSDDGPGISEDNMKRIFDPFFTTREVGKGPGLGLSVCYGIVQEHGGRICADSRLGEGATFVVEIPIVSDEQAGARQSDPTGIQEA